MWQVVVASISAKTAFPPGSHRHRRCEGRDRDRRLGMLALSGGRGGFRMKKFVVAVLAAGVLALGGGSPALAAQPDPLHYYTFDLSGGTPSGLTLADGGVTISWPPRAACSLPA